MRNGSTRRWRALRARILERDRGTCGICGDPGADAVDHIMPVAAGGAMYDPNNLQAAHHNVFPFCNRRKTDKLEHERTADLKTSGTLKHKTT